MLPYAPVHHLLLAGTAGPLVMTSGNLAGEPITFRDDQVAARLGPLCDAVLTHDRPIHVPCDDSVVRLVGHRSRRGDDAGGGLLPIRRSRGFAPVPVPLPGALRPVLAVGGELKNTFCVTSTDHAWVSQHLGDMGSVETLAAFEASVRHLEALSGVTPELVAVDAHPGYLTSRWARDRYGNRCLAVQHHHAHVASVMAEHGLDPDHQVIGLAFDGTGYGDDGTIWGGEVLIASAAGYRRFAHLAPVPLPGGDAAIANPDRVALAHLDAAGIAWGADLAPVAQLGRGEAGLLRRQLDRGFACVATTSMGRLFDAVASLLGLRHRISYEAQAAIDLEIAAARSSRLTAKGPAGSGPGGAGRSYRFSIGGATPAASIAIDPSEVLGAMIADLRAGRPADDIALGFHLAVADAAVEIATRARAVHGIGTVALSGGVFQNALLSTLCLAGLRDAGFEPLAHRVVPPNDGGLALGQAYIAAHRRHPPPEEI
jgi:hydrogenase maturation protein HypF